ncbi:portal protein [Pararhizobium mangrovi]|uniref:Portal protein n=1 Tax=Pararhizobium mangrovi TaxID=2590452 RepID=A0A506TX22_9HYPH|nr:hypothetical protein [Pararhizobium mangrovi]TPW25856.1 hypothetical protein FJU11_17515 [Pararhizobium mangrovi]
MDEKNNKKALSDKQIVSCLRPLIQKAEDTGDDAQRRERALDLYNRKPFPGDEKLKPSQSHHVESDVYDQTEMLTAQMMNIFEGQNDVVTYEPRGPEDEELAKQQTEMVNWVVRTDNNPTVFLTDWLKNGFIYGLGIVAAEFYSETKWKPPRTMTAVPDSMLAALLDDQSKDIRAVGENAEVQGPDGGTFSVRDVEIAHSEKKAGVRIVSIPPEDIILSSDAQFDYQTGGIDASLQGYKTTLPKRRLIETGYDEDLVNRIPVVESDDLDEPDRQHWGDDYDNSASEVEPEVTVYEVFLHLNTDGSDRTPLMHLTLGGDSDQKMVLLHKEEVEMAPLAAFVPSIDPNTIRGKGIADMIGEDQKIKSQQWRALIDNLNKVNYPRPIVSDGGVNYDDLMNDDIGAPIRAENQDAIKFVEAPFIANQVLTVCEAIDHSVERRTGTGTNTLALNPEDLKKTTATAASQRMSNSMLRVELIAKTFAATGYRYLFRVIGSLIASHPEDAQLISKRLRNKVVPVAPDAWDTGMDTHDTLSFGNTDKPQKQSGLMNILQLQQQAMQAGLPYVEPQHLYNTVSQIVKLHGFPNVGQFFSDPAKTQHKPQPDKPSPEQMQMQADMQRQQMELASKMEIEKMKLQQERQLKMAEIQADLEAKKYEANLRYREAMQEMGAETAIEGAKISAGQHASSNIDNPER